jgi:hypothetical protein
MDIIDQFLAGVAKAGEEQDANLHAATQQAAAMVKNPTPETLQAMDSPEALAVAQHNAAVAQGSVGKAAEAIEAGQAALAGKGAVNASQAAIQQAEAELAGALQANAQGLLSADKVAIAQRRLVNLKSRILERGYAEGGVVTPDPIDQFIAQPAAAAPVTSGVPVDPIDAFIAPEMHAARYGTLGQQILTGIEGVGEGATFGLTSGLENLAAKVPGLEELAPEHRLERRAENPGVHLAGNAAGLIGSTFIPGVGAGNILTKGGAAAARGLGLGAKGASFINMVGADAVKGAFEAAMMTGGDEVAKAFASDPAQSAQSAIADIGMSAILGGMFSGTIGAGLRKAGLGAALDGAEAGASKVASEAAEAAGAVERPTFVSQMDVDALEKGDYKTLIKHDNTMQPSFQDKVLSALELNKQVPDAAERIAAADLLGLPKPVGMTAESPAIQLSWDALAHSPISFSGKRVQDQLHQAAEGLTGIVNTVAGPSTRQTVEELGTSLQEGLTKKVRDAYAPISEMYDTVRAETPFLQVDPSHVAQIIEKVGEIPEVRLQGSSAKGLVDKIGGWLKGAQTADDLQAIATSAELKSGADGLNHIRGILKSSIKDVQDASIMRAARPEVKEMLREADKAYKPYIRKLSEVSEWLGKGKIRGTEDALTFINEKLSPSELSTKLFNSKDPAAYRMLEKNWPEEFAKVKDFKRATLVRGATDADTGELNLNKFFKAFNNEKAMPPEVKRMLFSPEEIKKLEAASLYSKTAFPKNFNPSGTSHMEALRKAAESPKSLALSNIRDKFLEKFIQYSGSPELKKANELARATVKAFDMTNKAVKAVLNPDKTTFPAAIAASELSRDKLKKEVDKHARNPSGLLDITGGAPVPQYAAHMSAAAANAVQYLNSIKPNETPKSPLDPKPVVSKEAAAKYNRAVDLVQQPLLVMKALRDGTLTSQDITTVKTVYPNLYRQIQTQVFNQVMDMTAKGQPVPYKTRLGISLLMHSPLDSTMQPQSIQNAQMSLMGQPAPSQPMPAQSAMKPKGSPKALTKLPSTYQTPDQARAARAQRQ